MENDELFATSLRSVEFTVYTTGARVSNVIYNKARSPEGFGGWNHMLIVVTVKGEKYVVDPGFGFKGACAPVLLKNNEIIANITPGVDLPSATVLRTQIQIRGCGCATIATGRGDPATASPRWNLFPKIL